MPKPVCASRQYELPQLRAVPYDKRTKLCESNGQDVETEFVSAKSISTYPTLPNHKRDGDPIADKLVCSITKNRVLGNI